MNSEQSHNGLHSEPWQVLPSAVVLSKREVQQWALVLDSRSIPCCIDTVGGAWQLLVPYDQQESALREIRLYEEANHNWPPPLPLPRRLVQNVLPTLSVLLLIGIFHNLTLLGVSIPGHGLLDLKEVGAAHASQIRNGQWWQCVTALTLHADVTHLLSNLTIGGVFILLLCRELGSGLAWSLLLCSGAVGNGINALLRGGTHVSVGASTAVFGAVGILAALSMVRYRQHMQRRWFVPVAAGVSLLAILGTEGERTDLGAHLFGFVTGIVLGGIAEYLIGRYGQPGRMVQALLTLVSMGGVLCAWYLAVTLSG